MVFYIILKERLLEKFMKLYGGFNKISFLKQFVEQMNKGIYNWKDL